MAYTLEISYFNSVVIKPKTELVRQDFIGGSPAAPGISLEDFESTEASNWHVEESRIKGGFNEDSMGYGVKAYATDESYDFNHRFNAMIYSGIFNSRTDINQTNEFNSS